MPAISTTFTVDINRERGRFAPRNTQAILRRSQKFADRLAAAIRNRAPFDTGTLKAGVSTKPGEFVGGADLRSINAQRLIEVEISTTTNPKKRRAKEAPREYAPFVEARYGFIERAFREVRF